MMDDAYTHLLLIVGGALLVVGSVFAWRSTDAMTTFSRDRSSAASAEASAPHALPPSPDSQSSPLEPSAENVDESVRQRKERLQQQVEATPSDTAARRSLADLLFAAHEPAAAAEQYRAYLERRPRTRQAWLNLANAYGAAQQWEEARRAARDMLSHFPDDPAALYNAGAAAANLGRYAEARTLWERALQQELSASVRSKTETALQRLDSLTVASSTAP